MANDKHFWKVYPILMGLGMLKPSQVSCTTLFEEIIKKQFRKDMTVDEFYEAYEAGQFTEYLQGRKDRLVFYKSWEWIQLKKIPLVLYGKKCMKCGSKKDTTTDHIISRYTDKSKSLDITNLQILCMSCNLDKSNKNVDYRKPEDLAKLEAYLQQQEIQKAG